MRHQKDDRLHTDKSVESLPANPSNDFIRIYVEGSTTRSYICFPYNGQQPSTQQATIWSCANSPEGDKTTDIAITEWYMRMFGWSKYSEKVIEAGIDNNNAACPILDMDISMRSFDPHSTNKTTEDRFWGEFREIAANPVGRILLYRLLIEIWREVEGTAEGGTEYWGAPIHNEHRKAIRSIAIKRADCRDFVWHYNGDERNITVNFSPLCKIATKVYKEGDRYKTGWGTTPISVYLFHEMLHWFHDLRDPERYSEESAPYQSAASLLWLFYFSGSTNAYISKDKSNEAWGGDDFGRPTQGKLFFKTEELRTILGINEETKVKVKEITEENTIIQLAAKNPHFSQVGYKQGDDLSENLFSCSLNHQFFQHEKNKQAAMRYGHSLRIIGGQNSPQIKLAHKVTINTIEKITHGASDHWQLKENEALISKN